METTSRDLSEGRGFPHVTEILSILENHNWTPEFALERGRHVHKACALLDGWGDGSGLDWDTLDVAIRPYLEAYVSFKKLYQFEPGRIEERIMSHTYRYQGTPDRVNQKEIWEIKCGPPRPVTGIQLAAYAKHFRRTLLRYSVHLHPTGKFTVEKWKDPSDFSVFLAALNCWNWRIRNGCVTASNG